MKQILIKNFKAYKSSDISDNSFSILLDKNTLIYGENGAGKSSLYSAIKIFFYREYMEEHLDDGIMPPEELEQKKNNFWSKYNNHANLTTPFSIEIQASNGNPISRTEYAVFMLDMKQLQSENMQLSSMLGTLLQVVDAASSIDGFCTQHRGAIAAAVNNQLEQFLERGLIYDIDAATNTIGLQDTLRHIPRKEADVAEYFNEARINLVKLLTYFEAIKIKAHELADRQKVLVLDDFVTSLDTTNRTFLVKYILETFSDFRIVILTHNINFYNLVKYIVNNINQEQGSWNFGNLYMKELTVHYYQQGSSKQVKKLKELYNPPSGSGNEALSTSEIAPLIRDRFEVLVHEFSKLLMIDYAEENKSILNRIMQNKTIYLKSRNEVGRHLLYELIEAINETTEEVILKQDLSNIIRGYCWSESNEFMQILSELKLYKKVVMNPSSHGVTPATSVISDKEIKKSLILLEKLESQLKNLMNKGVAGDI
jgi:energy-coupling factor transporter ATP-binding protein EcfA2